MQQAISLRKAKNIAFLFLIMASFGFIASIYLSYILKKNSYIFYIDMFKAICEAAMIGALADWFAVAALFKKIPIPIISKHTAIIPKNQKRIADNLAIFIHDKFLTVDSITRLLDQHQPIQKIAEYLCNTQHSQKITHYAMYFAKYILEILEQKAIQKFLVKALKSFIQSIDLAEISAMILNGLTKNNQHQYLLDKIIEKLKHILQQTSTQNFIAEQLIQWLKAKHPLKEKIIPSEWLGGISSEAALAIITHILDNISAQPQHALRQYFDELIQNFIVQLKSDEAMQNKVQEIQHYLYDDKNFTTYLQYTLRDLYTWISIDLNNAIPSQSKIYQNIHKLCIWLGHNIQNDSALQNTLHDYLQKIARSITPDCAEFLATHIRNTIQNWHTEDMVEHIELNIGKDLQFIRMNGTIVGGLIGLILYVATHIHY
jgi:uncharacterized membrane-anchored protein YjiN (DUF445 family)